MALNLEKQILFYGSYHNNPVNVIIHVVCVPVIMGCILLLGASTGSLFDVPNFLVDKYITANPATIAALIYSTLYILMEPVAGALLAPLLISASAFVTYLNSAYGITAIYWSLAVQAVAWIAQFVGHGVFEGRAPALLDNLVQALFLAPFFVWLEILFFLGYRPELKSRIDKEVQKELAKFKKSKAEQELKGKQNSN
ncbi:hypothetical protein FQN57_005464 [Myotisia sp. PD_48]|nr:hypothetical protein FQN57_005464 [Myotisia sp. PD_48]